MHIYIRPYIAVCIYIYWTLHPLAKQEANILLPRPKTTRECGIFKYLGSILTNDGRCTCEIKCRIAMAKAAFNRKRTLFNSTLDLELRKNLVKCYVWSIALYGAETPRKFWNVVLEEDGKDQLGLIMWEMKMYCLESRSRGISYMKYVNGRRTGLVTFWVEIAFYNGWLKERYKGG